MTEVIRYVIGDIELTKHPIDVVDAAARVSHDSTATVFIDRLKLVRNLLEWGHMTPFEFLHCRFLLGVDRAIANELVRHRLASFVQESTRYVDYSETLPVIYPTAFDLPRDDIEEGDSKLDEAEVKRRREAVKVMQELCDKVQESYRKLMDLGYKAEVARATLPQCTATKIVVDMNFRELLHMLTLRTSSAAHPDMVKVMQGLVQAISATDPEWGLLLHWALVELPPAENLEDEPSPSEECAGPDECMGPAE